MQSGDAAEQMVRFSFEGAEFALKIVGGGAKQIGAMLLAALQSDGKDAHLKLKGRERLTNMLKSGQPLKIFTVKNSDLEQFTQEAKKYGVVYCVLKEKGGDPDSLVDIMAREDDASKIARIQERLKFATVDRATIEPQPSEQTAHDREVPDRDDNADKLLDQLLDAEGNAKTVTPEADQSTRELQQVPVPMESAQANPTTERVVSPESPPSDSRSKTPFESGAVIRATRKPESPKAFLRERTAQNAAQREQQKANRKVQPRRQQRQRLPQHEQPQRRGRTRKRKER